MTSMSAGVSRWMPIRSRTVSPGRSTTEGRVVTFNGLVVSHDPGAAAWAVPVPRAVTVIDGSCATRASGSSRLQRASRYLLPRLKERFNA